MAKNGTKGVYDKDQRKHDDAVMYDALTLQEVLEKNLLVMDSTAASICKDNKINIVVFDMNEKGNIKKAVMQEKIGTMVTWED